MHVKESMQEEVEVSISKERKRGLELIFGQEPTFLLADGLKKSTDQFSCTRPVDPELSETVQSVAVALYICIDFVFCIRHQ
jgi:hypothetical protein